jgi:hypothetical protein
MLKYPIFEVITAVNIQVEVVSVVTPCSVVVGYHITEDLAASIFSLHSEDRPSMTLRNVGALQQQYTAS